MSDNSDRRLALASALERVPNTQALTPRLGGAGASHAAAGGAIPVLEPLAGLLPSGLTRGDAVALASPGQEVDYLALALLAGALAAGLWCAAVGVPTLGGIALSDLLADTKDPTAALDRLLLVPEPGRPWPQIVSVLADGVDVLLLRPSTAVSAETTRRVDARLRQGRSVGTRHSAALLVLGSWPGARLTLRTENTVWTGLDGLGPSAGTGHLTGRRATLVAQGRATAGRPRTACLWLPDARGTASTLTEDTAPVSGPQRARPPAVA